VQTLGMALSTPLSPYSLAAQIAQGKILDIVKASPKSEDSGVAV
jgi:hypothetical protein